MRFYASSTFAKDAAIATFAGQPLDLDNFCEHWFMHRVTIKRRKCVIAMEAHTRYAMLFCGMTKPGFIEFPALFADRLWRNIVSVCEIPAAEFAAVKARAQELYAAVEWRKFQNRSVQSHVKDAAHELEWLIVRDGFPADIVQEFTAGVRINQTPRTRHGEKKFIVPLEEFQRLWCEMLGVRPMRFKRWGER